MPSRVSVHITWSHTHSFHSHNAEADAVGFELSTNLLFCDLNRVFGIANLSF